MNEKSNIRQNTLEFFNQDDITIEKSNIFLSQGEIEEQSYNISVPANSHNRVLFGMEAYTSPSILLQSTDFQTIRDCTVSIDRSIVLSKLNIDRLDIENNSIDCTLYPNKQLITTLQTPIRELLKSDPKPWFPWSYWFKAGECNIDWIPVVGIDAVSTLLKFYCNGANNHFLKDRAYLTRYGYNKDYITEDPTNPYKYKGIGAFKDFQLHPSMNAVYLLSRIKANPNIIESANLIDTDSIYADQIPWIIPGKEYICPNNRTQFCCWSLGTKRQNTYTTVGQTYRDGRFAIPIAKLGSHVCTELESISGSNLGDGEGDVIVFNRDCQIQFQKIHCFADKYNLAPESGYIRFELVHADDSEPTNLFSWHGSLIKSVIQNTLKGFHQLDYEVDYEGSPSGPRYLLHDIMRQNIVIKKGDKLRVVIDCNGDKKLNLRYFNLVLKWTYIEDSYEILDDDWTREMTYYSGLKSGEGIDPDYESFPNIPHSGSEQSHINAVYEMFEDPYFEYFYDWHEFTDKSEKWDEIPVYNYYDFYTNLGELTPLKLATDICVINDWDLTEREDGTYSIRENTRVVEVKDAELKSINYLNDTFGVNNIVEYENGGQKIVSKTDNLNLERNQVIYELGASSSEWKGQYLVVKQYEQDGDITDTSAGCKLAEDSNYYFFNLDYTQSYKQTSSFSYLFDNLLKNDNSNLLQPDTINYSWLYNFEVPRVISNCNYVCIDGIIYMIKSMVKDIKNNITNITCFPVRMGQEKSIIILND